MDEFALRGTDGVDVFVRRWLPDGAPRLVVLVAHGLSEHSGRYDRVARALCADGYAVYAPDHRGHGRTAASTGVGRTGAPGIDGVLSDLHQLSEIAVEEVPGVPVVLVGHSMGAILSLAYAERYGRELAGLVLSGSPGADDNAKDFAKALRDMLETVDADEPMAALAVFNEAFEPARTPYDWLSRDPAEVDAYIADPLCGDDMPMTYGFLASLMTLLAGEIEPEAIATIPSTVPVLLLTGASDPASNGAQHVHALEERLRAAGLTVDAIYYPDARHEVLNETNRDEVEADLRTWLHKVVAANG